MVILKCITANQEISHRVVKHYLGLLRMQHLLCVIKVISSWQGWHKNEFEIVVLKLETSRDVVLNVKRFFFSKLLASKVYYLKNIVLPKYKIESRYLFFEDM